jgi:hypothetical protein
MIIHPYIYLHSLRICLSSTIKTLRAYRPMSESKRQDLESAKDVISGWFRFGGGRHTVHQDTYIQIIQSIDSVTFDMNVASRYCSGNEEMNLLLNKILTVMP